MSKANQASLEVIEHFVSGVAEKFTDLMYNIMRELTNSYRILRLRISAFLEARLAAIEDKQLMPQNRSYKLFNVPINSCSNIRDVGVIIGSKLC